MASGNRPVCRAQIKERHKPAESGHVARRLLSCGHPGGAGRPAASCQPVTPGAPVLGDHSTWGAGPNTSPARLSQAAEGPGSGAQLRRPPAAQSRRGRLKELRPPPPPLPQVWGFCGGQPSPFPAQASSELNIPGGRFTTNPFYR